VSRRDTVADERQANAADLAVEEVLEPLEEEVEAVDRQEQVVEEAELARVEGQRRDEDPEVDAGVEAGGEQLDVARRGDAIEERRQVEVHRDIAGADRGGREEDGQIRGEQALEVQQLARRRQDQREIADGALQIHTAVARRAVAVPGPQLEAAAERRGAPFHEEPEGPNGAAEADVVSAEVQVAREARLVEDVEGRGVREVDAEGELDRDVARGLETGRAGQGEDVRP
jgi:hypothetical protein